MRHQVVKKKLGRDAEHRTSLIKNLSAQLIENEKITTTEVKAKWLRPYIERLISKATKVVGTEDKIKKFNAVKYLRTKLSSESAIKKLIETVAPMYTQRPGGYTRVVKTGNRDGDNSKMARIELVKGNEHEK
jgi:large subunit ribosomal protein L17